MEQYRKTLGKVVLTCNDYWDKNKGYDILCLVEDKDTNKNYISKKEVPVGVLITNREYWQPIASMGAIDNGIIILNHTDINGNIPYYDLISAAKSISPKDRRPGLVLGYLNYDSNTDDLPQWKLYQYNDVDLANWLNISSWQALDYNKGFIGWFPNEEELYKEYGHPKYGMYAYVGEVAVASVIYRADDKNDWINTGEKAFNYIVNFADEEDITNKNNTIKFADKIHNPEKFSGLGRTYLRKNIVDGINVLTQDMMSKENTIYIIQYDYDLNGAEITVPEGCVLDFQGGSLSNGILRNASVSNDSGRVIFKDVEIDNPKEQLVELRWFNYTSLADAVENACKFKHVDAMGDWAVDRQIHITNDIELFNGKFKCIAGTGVTSFLIESHDVLPAVNIGDVSIPSGTTKISYGGVGSYQMVKIQGDDIWYKDASRNNRVGEIMPISSISENETTFKAFAGVVCSYSTNVKLTYFNPIDVDIRNCVFYGDELGTLETNELNNNGNMLCIFNAIANVENCNFRGLSVGVALKDCFLSTVNSNVFSHVYPYPILYDGVSNSTVNNNRCEYARHLYTTSGGTSITKHIVVSNNTCLFNLLAICPHCGSYDTLITNNVISDGFGGIGTYGPYTSIVGNRITRIKNTSGTPYVGLYELGLYNVNIINNTIEDCLNSTECIKVSNSHNDLAETQLEPQYINISGNFINNNSNSAGIYIDISNYSEYISVKCSDNFVKGCRYIPISIVGGKQVYVFNNVCNGSSGGYHGLYVQGQSNVSADSNYAYVKNNSMVSISGAADDEGVRHNIFIDNFNRVYSANNTSSIDRVIDYGNSKNVFESLMQNRGITAKEEGQYDYLLGINSAGTTLKVTNSLVANMLYGSDTVDDLATAIGKLILPNVPLTKTDTVLNKTEPRIVAKFANSASSAGTIFISCGGGSDRAGRVFLLQYGGANGARASACHIKELSTNSSYYGDIVFYKYYNATDHSTEVYITGTVGSLTVLPLFVGGMVWDNITLDTTALPESSEVVTIE